MRRLLPLLLAIAVLASCGGDSGIGKEASEVLRPRVEGVQAAAAAGDRSALDAALADLRAQVGDLRSRFVISEDEATEILAAAKRVEDESASVVTTTTTPPPPPTTTAPPRRVDGDGDSERDEGGKGKGAGKGGGDD